MALQHVVLFRFPAELSAEDWAEMRRQVRSWPDEIGGFDRLRLAPSINTERTLGFQYLLYMELVDQDALVAYQRHPVHQTFLRWVTERECTPLAFDYYLDGDSVIL